MAFVLRQQISSAYFCHAYKVAACSCSSFVPTRRFKRCHLAPSRPLAGKADPTTESSQSATHHDRAADVLQRTSRDASTAGSSSGWTRRWRRAASSVLSAGGLVASTAAALATDRTQYQQQWKPSVAALRKYLETSGIDSELAKAWNTRLLDNLVILARIQKLTWADLDRRDTAPRSASLKGIPSNEEALRYMKYATAVYGESMIRAAEMDIYGRLDDRISPLTKTRIGEHVGIPEDDIVLMDVDYYGADSNHLRHFVAVDREHQTVILTIRGTFSVSEVFLDVAAFSRPFCGGEAHSEMANMAEKIWDAAGPTVLDLLRQNEGYTLVLTGHSLGAGTACLLNVLCQQNDRELVEGRSVKCFAYSAPPVFAPLSLIEESVSTCTNYVHENDCISFLSVDSIRHLIACIHAIGSHTEQLSWSSRMKLVTGWTAPDVTLIDVVKQASSKRLDPKPGAPLLAIAAGSVVWLRANDDGHTYNKKICDPAALAVMGVWVNPDMLLHHFPPRYEHALHNLE